MADSNAVVRNLVVIGLGLIGGSLAQAARERGLCERVIGIARRQEVADRAVAKGVVDEAFTALDSVASELTEGDLIFVAVPTLSMSRILQEIHRCTSSAVTITDGASVKGSVLRDVKGVYGCIPPQFVPGHPIAGSEKSGVEASNPALYIDHRVIITPHTESGSSHIDRVTRLWEGVGAEVLSLDVEEHDEILAATSHLPHAIAFSLVDTLAHDSHNQDIFRYAAGGFRDFTRIASSDAVMWRDIMLANSEDVVASIELFVNNLQRLKRSIENRDSDELFDVFTRAKKARDFFSKCNEGKNLD